MSDEFSGIFDDLNPDDFDRETSAVHVKTDPQPQEFNDFVDRWIDATRLGFHASDGSMNPIAVLLSPDGRRMFSPDDDETLGQYIERLSREARKHRATWFFTAVLTKGGVYTSGEDNGKPIGDTDAIQEAQKQNAMKPCIYWYAERRNDQVNGDVIRHGIIAVNDNTTGEIFEAPPQHASPVYREVLGK